MNKSNASHSRAKSSSAAPKGASGSTGGQRHTPSKKKKKNNSSSTTQSGVVQTITAPTNVGTVSVSGQPRITRTSRSCRIANDELVLPALLGSTSFVVQSSLAINPGLPGTFPWLSIQAAGWEQYKIHKLHVRYVNITSSTAGGAVIISPSYDASDPVPTTEQQAANTFGALTLPVWTPGTFVADVGAMMALGPRRFVRSSACAGDIKTFDAANIHICTNDETSTNKVGKIYLDYDIEFFVPQNDPSGSTFPSTVSMFAATAVTLTTAVVGIMPLGIVYDPLRILAQNVSNVWTPPAGTYEIHFKTRVSNSASATLSAQAYLRKNSSQIVNSLVQQDTAAFGAASSSELCGFYVVTCNGTDTLEYAVLATGTGVLTANDTTFTFRVA